MIQRRKFITLLGGHGRSRRARSRAPAYGASACATKTLLRLLRRRLKSLPSRKRLRAWAGSMVATCGWTFGGAAVTSIGYERSRGNRGLAVTRNDLAQY
jgi:hypothetical protein